MEKLNRTPVIIASIIFAIGLWLTVNLGFDYTTTKEIPIAVQNIADDVALRSPPPETIRARVQGEGWKLLGMKIGGDTKYIIDVENERSSVTIRTSADLSERMRIPSGIEITDLQPSQLTILMEPKTSKRIPIEPDLEVTFRNGFSKVGEPTLSPDSVTVSGAESIVAALHTWQTEPIVLRDLRAPVRKTVALSDSLSQIISLDVASTEVRFDVQPIAEQTISGLRVHVEGVPQNREVLIIPPRIDLVVRGGINRLAEIDEESYTARIHYRDLLADTSGTISARIEGPQDIRIVQRSPERLQYVIRRIQ